MRADNIIVGTFSSTCMYTHLSTMRVLHHVIPKYIFDFPATIYSRTIFFAILCWISKRIQYHFYLFRCNLYLLAVTPVSQWIDVWCFFLLQIFTMSSATPSATQLCKLDEIYMSLAGWKASNSLVKARRSRSSQMFPASEKRRLLTQLSSSWLAISQRTNHRRTNSTPTLGA